MAEHLAWWCLHRSVLVDSTGHHVRDRAPTDGTQRGSPSRCRVVGILTVASEESRAIGVAGSWIGVRRAHDPAVLVALSGSTPGQSRRGEVDVRREGHNGRRGPLESHLRRTPGDTVRASSARFRQADTACRALVSSARPDFSNDVAGMTDSGDPVSPAARYRGCQRNRGGLIAGRCTTYPGLALRTWPNKAEQ